MVPLLALFGLGLSGMATSLASQTRTAAVNSSSPSVPDSSDLHDRARDAQAAFERARVRFLPWARGVSGTSWICDERVGRMCWRHDDPEEDWTPPEEDERLVAAREELLQVLGEVLAETPGDLWVLGQWTWYMGEAGRWDESLRRTRACLGGDRSWCAALAGLALHKLQRFEEAEQVFARAGPALERLQSNEDWELRVLLDGRGRDWLEKQEEPNADEGERDPGPDPLVAVGADRPRLSARERLWLLSDPMYLVPGNDRKTEHLARRVVSRIRDKARNPYRMSWGADLGQLVVRYGWAVSWERVRVRAAGLDDRSIIGHHEPKGRGFIPDGKVLEALAGPDPSAADDEDLENLDLDPVAERPRTTYKPAYTRVIRPAEAAAYGFDRGDSTWIVGVFADTAATDSLEAQSGFAADLRTGEIRVGRPVGPRSWVVHVPTSPHVASLERLGPPEADGARHRSAFFLALRPREVVALSDLLLLDDGGEPASFDDMAARIHLGEVEPGAPFQLAWETYGLGFDDAPGAYRLSIASGEGGLLSRLGGWVGLGDDEEPILLEWTEPQPEDPGPVLRSIRVELPPLEPGRYRLRLELALPGRSAVIQDREIRIAGDP